MFPDRESVWEGYPSIIDGLGRPHVQLLGNMTGRINLVVTGERSEPFAYAVTAPVRLFFVVDEFEYSVLDHGEPFPRYDGKTYVQRAVRSKLLDAYRQSPVPEMIPSTMHFALVGGGDCVEFITQSHPTILPLHTKIDLANWIADAGTAMREILDWG